MTTIAEWSVEFRAINIEHGWRSAEGGPGTNTWGDYVALLHSELGEALDAYRDHKVADATAPICGRATNGEDPCPEHGPSKPEGVGSELADVFIRLVDMADVFGYPAYDMECQIGDVAPLATAAGSRTTGLVSFGDWITFLHDRVFHLGDTVGPDTRAHWSALTLRALVTCADHWGLNLEAEVERKTAYNRIREFKHGGREL